MARTIDRITLWTEGLDINWVAEQHNRQRLSRGPLDLSQFSGLLEKIRFNNNGHVDGLLILQGTEKRLHITVQEDHLLLSDPQNPNYQNVHVKESELKDFIEEYFLIEEEAQNHEWTNLHLVHYSLLLLGLIGLGGAIYYLMDRISFDHSFYPRVLVTEIDDRPTFDRLRDAYAGVYATGVRDGAMVIELTPDLRFHYYDMRQSTPGLYILDMVMEGDWRPVYDIEGSEAIIAKERLLLHPRDDEQLIFEDRTHERLAKSRADLPSLGFPEETEIFEF